MLRRYKAGPWSCAYWAVFEPTNPTGDPDPSGDSIPTPERVDAGFGGAALGSHQAAGLALIAAAVVLALLVVVLARRHRAEARSAR